MEVMTIGTNIGSVSRSKSVSREGTVWTDDATPAAGESGLLTTRTDDDTGIITIASHGILMTDKVDVGWVDADSINRNRARMDVTAKDTNTLTVDSGSGVALPAQDYAVVVGKRSEITFSCDGNTIEILSLYSAPPTGQAESRAMVDFVTSVPATIFAFDLDDNAPFSWVKNSPIPNPLADGTVSAIEISSLTTQAPEISLEIVYEAGP